ncbi:MAG: hypothetical protein K5985_04395 [Lachnospiraceae bacterium]|nr:hypothetical protein [Lachnospiraceae bacterium]
MQNRKLTNRIRGALTWSALIILMVFYAGTWTFPGFYHVTEIYNTLIVFIALALLFFGNISLREKLRQRDVPLILMGAVLILALVNLFIIHSNKGCFLILADFLLVFYLGKELVLSERMLKILEIFFLVMYASWFIYDRAFFYNANTGATVTVLTLFGAWFLLEKISKKYTLGGFLVVLVLVRTVTLVLWHLARGAFLMLFVFLVLFFLLPERVWRNRKFFYGISLFACFGSLLFVVSYIALAKTGVNPRLPFFYKNVFSGREMIWQEVWDLFKTMPFTGIGSGRALKSFFEYNIHNAMYDILAVHGIPVFALSVSLILMRLFSAGRKLEEYGADAGRRCAAAAIFALFIESFIDMDLMWADYSPVLLLLLLELFRRGGGAPGKAGKGHG